MELKHAKDQQLLLQDGFLCSTQGISVLPLKLCKNSPKFQVEQSQSLLLKRSHTSMKLVGTRCVLVGPWGEGRVSWTQEHSPRCLGHV